MHCGPGAALCLASSLRATDGPGRRGESADAVVHVAVERGRRVAAVPGVEVHRYAGLSARVQWNLGPPRVRYDEAVLDVAAAATDDLAAVAALADACGARRTTAARLRTRLADRPRIARRTWLQAVLDDVADGTCSVLEHGYLTRVVLPQGLPRGELQAPAVAPGRAAYRYRDVAHRDLDLAVELDGHLFHTSVVDRHQDLSRDLEAAARDGLLTVRLGYGQVFTEACRTAVLLGVLMHRRGWTGQRGRCPECGAPDQPG